MIRCSRPLPSSWPESLRDRFISDICHWSLRLKTRRKIDHQLMSAYYPMQTVVNIYCSNVTIHVHVQCTVEFGFEWLTGGRDILRDGNVTCTLHVRETKSGILAIDAAPLTWTICLGSTSFCPTLTVVHRTVVRYPEGVL